MSLYLTSNKLFTPVIFDKLPISVKVLEFGYHYYSSGVNLSDSFDMTQLTEVAYEEVDVYRYVIRRPIGIRQYNQFYGGMLDNSRTKLLALIVRDNESNLYGIFNKELITIAPDKKRLFKQFVNFGVLEDNIIEADTKTLTYEFNIPLKLTVKSYDKDIQYKLSRKFIREKYASSNYRFGYDMLHRSICSVHH